MDCAEFQDALNDLEKNLLDLTKVCPPPVANKILLAIAYKCMQIIEGNPPEKEDVN